MSLSVKEIRAWLATLHADDQVGIDEDGFNLTLADERYDTVSLELGMALSSEWIEAQDKEHPSWTANHKERSA